MSIGKRNSGRGRLPAWGHLALGLCLALSGCAAGSAAEATSVSYDLVITNGRVMDPETGLDAVRNVGISGGRIVEISGNALTGKATIDAKGLVVAPGFIDLHAHDHSELTYRLHAQDGVTSALELEGGAYPVSKWYQPRIGKSSINFGASASHGVIRAVVMNEVDESALTGDSDVDSRLPLKNPDWGNLPTTPSQRARMDDMIRAELRDGAVGIGYHLVTTPGADKDEMLHFYGLSAAEKVANFIHIRSVGQVSPAQAGVEVVEAARKSGASIHAVHVNSSGLWETQSLLDQFAQARAEGLDVTTEVYPYTGAASRLNDPRMQGGFEAFKLSYGDLQLVSTGERLTKESFAAHRAKDPDGDLIAHIMKQSDIDAAVAFPDTIIASDGDKYVNGRGHPRGAGTFARIFSHYVRELKSLSLMEALRRTSYLPARRLESFVPSMRERGRIKPGAYADITIFDPARIADQATYQEGALPSVGIAYVIVNGTPVVSGYHFQEGVHPGLPIRSGSNKQ